MFVSTKSVFIFSVNFWIHVILYFKPNKNQYKNGRLCHFSSYWVKTHNIPMLQENMHAENSILYSLTISQCKGICIILRKKCPNMEFFLVRIFFTYSVSLRMQSECGKIRTRKNSVFWHFSHSDRDTQL